MNAFAELFGFMFLKARKVLRFDDSNAIVSLLISLLVLGSGKVGEELVENGSRWPGVGLNALLVKDLGRVDADGDVHAG